MLFRLENLLLLDFGTSFLSGPAESPILAFLDLKYELEVGPAYFIHNVIEPCGRFRSVEHLMVPGVGQRIIQTARLH